jgi:hypothetical protein
VARFSSFWWNPSCRHRRNSETGFSEARVYDQAQQQQSTSQPKSGDAMTTTETSLAEIERGLTNLVAVAMDQSHPEIRAKLAADIAKGLAAISFRIQINPAFLICEISRPGSAPIEFFRCSHERSSGLKPNVTVN